MCIFTPSLVVNLAPSSPLPSRASASSFKALCAIIVCANRHILSNIYRLEWQGEEGGTVTNCCCPEKVTVYGKERKKTFKYNKISFVVS